VRVCVCERERDRERERKRESTKFEVLSAKLLMVRWSYLCENV